MDGALVPSSVVDLEQYEEVPMELATEYWTPKAEGEVRVAFYMGTEIQKFPDAQKPDEYKDVKVALFCQKQTDGSVQQFANGSKRLTAIMELQEEGKPYKITYKGKVENKSNANEGSAWSVKRMVKKGGAS